MLYFCHNFKGGGSGADESISTVRHNNAKKVLACSRKLGKIGNIKGIFNLICNCASGIMAKSNTERFTLRFIHNGNLHPVVDPKRRVSLSVLLLYSTGTTANQIIYQHG